MSQVIKKTTIVIASVLKPIDDTRMFEKIAQQLADTKAYDVHVIGFPSRKPVASPGITFHSLRYFSRLSPERMLATFDVFWRMLRIKPGIIIITTHELLMAGLLAKFLFQCKLVYDVQENYYRNIRYTKAFAPWLRPALARYVRWKEQASSSMVDLFFIAEKNYRREIPFLKQCIELPNKFKPPASLPPVVKKGKSDNGIHLLFSGTLAETTGVFEAIAMAEALHEADSSIQLTLIGYCPQPATLERLRHQVQSKPWITVKGASQLVPHDEIIVEIMRSDFGILSYPPNPSTQGAMPTKLYEYLALELPMLLAPQQPGQSLVIEHQAAVLCAPPYDTESIISQMKTSRFYPKKPDDVFWKPEGEKMLVSLAELERSR